ncbi:DNA-binding protein [Trichoderma pleuroticola]
MSASPQPPPAPQESSLLPHDANPLLSSFTSFLTIAIHSLLFHRRLYPPTSFLAARAYNLPVHQSRHPRLCAWIADAVAAITVQLRAGSVRRIVLAVHSPASVVRERWVFDVHRFPAWGDDAEEPDAPTSHQQEDQQEEEEDEEEEEEEEEAEDDADEKLNWPDIHEALRAALQRLAYTAQGAPKLPPGCTFTLALELRGEAEAPIGHPQPWIPSQGPLQPPTAEKPHQGESLRGAATKPVRSVRADPLFFECWLEQGPPDAAAVSSNSGIVTNTSLEKEITTKGEHTKKDINRQVKKK